MMVLGITGTLGSGKGTIVEYLVENYHFTHFSVSGYLTEIIKQQGMSVNRDTMAETADKLRKRNGSEYLVKQLYQKAKETGNNSIIESIRTPGEVRFLKTQSNFYLIAVDADIKIRYKRIRMRDSEKDNVSFEKFSADEEREKGNTEPYKMNLTRCIEMADFKITNNSSFADLYMQVEAAIKACGGKGL